MLEGVALQRRQKEREEIDETCASVCGFSWLTKYEKEGVKFSNGRDV